MNTSTTIGEVAKTLNNDDNLILQNSSFVETCKYSSDLLCKISNNIGFDYRFEFNYRLGIVNTLMELYGGQWSLLHGRCSYSQRDDTIYLDPGFNSSDHMIFDRQECKGIIRAFQTHFLPKNRLT